MSPYRSYTCVNDGIRCNTDVLLYCVRDVVRQITELLPFLGIFGILQVGEIQMDSDLPSVLLVGYRA